LDFLALQQKQFGGILLKRILLIRRLRLATCALSFCIIDSPPHTPQDETEGPLLMATQEFATHYNHHGSQPQISILQMLCRQLPPRLAKCIARAA
jgi:hypothetical protein